MPALCCCLSLLFGGGPGDDGTIDGNNGSKSVVPEVFVPLENIVLLSNWDGNTGGFAKSRRLLYSTRLLVFD